MKFLSLISGAFLALAIVAPALAYFPTNGQTYMTGSQTVRMTYTRGKGLSVAGKKTATGKTPSASSSMQVVPKTMSKDWPEWIGVPTWIVLP